MFDVSHLKCITQRVDYGFVSRCFYLRYGRNYVIQIAYSLESDERNKLFPLGHDHGNLESPLKNRSGFINRDYTPTALASIVFFWRLFAVNGQLGRQWTLIDATEVDTCLFALAFLHLPFCTCPLEELKVQIMSCNISFQHDFHRIFPISDVHLELPHTCIPLFLVTFTIKTRI